MGSVPSRQPKRERRQGTPRGGRRADDSHPSVRLTLDGQVARNQSTGPSLADGSVHRLIFFFFPFYSKIICLSFTFCRLAEKPIKVADSHLRLAPFWRCGRWRINDRRLQTRRDEFHHITLIEKSTNQTGRRLRSPTQPCNMAGRKRLPRELPGANCFSSSYSASLSFPLTIGYTASSPVARR